MWGVNPLYRILGQDFHIHHAESLPSFTKMLYFDSDTVIFGNFPETVAVSLFAHWSPCKGGVVVIASAYFTDSS